MEARKGDVMKFESVPKKTAILYTTISSENHKFLSDLSKQLNRKKNDLINEILDKVRLETKKQNKN